MRRLLALLLVLPVAAGAFPSPGALTLAVTPACCAITFTAYAFGLFPIEGGFTRFEGQLLLAQPGGTPAGALRAEATIDAASLSLGGGPIEEDVKSPRFLDVTQHRQIRFAADAPDAGIEAGAMLRGELTIRGVTRPVTLSLARDGTTVTAEAMISRSAFCRTARPLLSGDTVAIRVTAPLAAR